VERLLSITHGYYNLVSMEHKLDEADKPILLRSTIAGENLTSTTEPDRKAADVIFIHEETHQ